MKAKDITIKALEYKNRRFQSQLKEMNENNQKLKFAILQFAKQGTKLLEEVNKIETSKTK